jgi:sulfur-oxidizing protein SoxY
MKESSCIENPNSLSRRDALRMSSGVLVLSLVPLWASTDEIGTAAAIKRVFGDRVPTPGRITLKLPALAESGNSVPLTVSIDTPMSEADRVERVCVFANHNPRPLVATVIFGPKSGTPTFSTNMRLSGTQDVIAVAEMADHSLWSAQVRVLVTVGACDALQTRY